MLGSIIMLHAATSFATLRKEKDASTFLATRKATFCRLREWDDVTRAIVLATCNATFVALQIAGKIALCNMAFTEKRVRCQKK